MRRGDHPGFVSFDSCLGVVIDTVRLFSTASAIIATCSAIIGSDVLIIAEQY